MRPRLFNYLCGILGLAWLVSPLAGAVRVVPTPQYIEPTKEVLLLAPSTPVVIVLGPAQVAGNEKLRLAADFLRHDLEQADPSLQVAAQTGSEGKAGGAHIYLWDYSADHKPGVELSFLDSQVLTDPDHYGQSYVIRAPDENSMWVVGSTDEGVLLGAMSVLQLMQKTAQGVEIEGVYIRDYPDFRYRAAADWLLNVEINRWALDWGQGIEGYRQVCERKLDEALRFKINVVLLDGFGWGLKQRFPGYGKLMRGLNRYARARGIHLQYGGYGASYGIAYQSGPLYEAGGYMGEIFKNRERYPDGPTYQCMGFPGARNEVDTRTLGSCRANEELNRLKASELRTFVDTVEPGALLIHHEDFGGYHGTEDAWQQRCPRCRRQWPNNSLKAAAGGAGGLARGYSALIGGVNSVRHPSDGYDASRDCLIILTSPVYAVDSPSSSDWSDVLELWKNIGLQLPRENNVLVCFRETFPQPYGGEGWVKAFNSTMRAAGLNLGAYLFFFGGADSFYTNYPSTGAPALDVVFRGAAAIGNASGDFYEEPMEIVNAQYEWNTRPSSLFRNPRTYQEAMDLLHDYIYKDQPRELFDANGIYRIACNLLYGSHAGPIMASYYQESKLIMDTPSGAAEEEQIYLPKMFDRAYAIPEHWRDLAVDAKTWDLKIEDRTYAAGVARLHIDAKELHRRLARHWAILAELNAKGAQDIQEALRSDPRPESVEGLKFLTTSFQVDQPLLEALADFHRGMEAYFTSPPKSEEAKAGFQRALKGARKSHEMALQAFPHPIDPVGGEVGAIRDYSARLAEAIERMLRI